MAITNESLFSTKAVPASVQAELNARASKTYNPMHGQAKTWIHVMSLAEGAPAELKTYGTYSEAYDENNRPRTLVQSVKVAAKGEYGTTRSATVEMIVFSDEELNRLADSYFIPDMSVRLQWGWSINTMGEAPPTVYTTPAYDSAAIRTMQQMAENYPNYEGFQGRVVSWNITLEPKDNAWNISLELIGAANSISEVPVSATSAACKCEKTITGQTAEGDNKETKQVQEVSPLYAALSTLYEKADNISQIKAATGGYSGEFVAERIKYPGFSRDEEGKEDSETTFMISADLDADETFISWGTVESLLSYYSAQQHTATGPSSFKIDSRGLQVKVPMRESGWRWFSADPKVCILPGGGLTFKEPTEWTDYFAVVPIVGIFVVASKDGAAYGKSSGDCFADNTHIKLTDIRVSVVHLLKRLKEFESNKDSIMTTLTTLLSDINKACGSPWEFEVVDVSAQAGVEDGGASQLAVIDTNAPEAKTEPFVFLATPSTGGFCREIKLELKMTEAMKTQALYGASGKTDPDSIPNGGKTPCSSRFMQYSSEMKRSLGKPTGPEIVTNEAVERLCKTFSSKCNDSNSVGDIVDRLATEAVGVNIDAARTFLEEERRKGEIKALEGSGVSEYCATSALPMNFSATVTGIGGFKWGQLVTCDRLPQDMRTILKYQVTTVEHNITVDDWTTTVNTIARKSY